MPDSTTVWFIDRAGNERAAVRQRGQPAREQDTLAPINLELADMGQGASGRLAREYAADPASLRRFLDAFVDLGGHRERQRELLSALEENAAEIVRAHQGTDGLEQAKEDVQSLQSTLSAAQNSKVEQLAVYAAQLAAETTLLARLDAAIAAMLEATVDPVAADLRALASETGTNLGERPAADYVGGTEGVETLLSFAGSTPRRIALTRRGRASSAGSRLRQR